MSRIPFVIEDMPVGQDADGAIVTADLLALDRETCSFCGGKHPTACWDNSVFCCPKCAVKVLPKFMADAIFPCRQQMTPPRVDVVRRIYDRAHRKWAEARAFYWMAIAAALGGEFTDALRRRAEPRTSPGAPTP